MSLSLPPDPDRETERFKFPSPGDLDSVGAILRRLTELGLSPAALAPVFAWLEARHDEHDIYHQRHLAVCGIKSLAGHRYGWINCPEFICRHCDSPPDATGDHSCPCPHRDEDCPNHPEADQRG